MFADLLSYYSSHQDGLVGRLLSFMQALFPSATEAQVITLFGGVLFALYSLLQFIAAPIWGSLSDKYGRRPVLLVSIAGNTVAYLLWAWAGSFWLVIISRLLSGAMSGNISAATAAMADISSREERAKSMGMLGAAFGLGFILGPAIGGITYEFLPRFTGDFTSFWHLNPFSVPAFVAGGLSAVNAIWAWLRFHETLPKDKRSIERRTLNPLRFFDPSLGQQLVRLNLVYCAYIILFSGMEGTLVFLTMDVLNFTTGNNTALFVWFGFMAAMIQGGVVRKLAPRIGEKRMCRIGLLLVTVGFLLLAAVTWLPTAATIVAAITVITCGSSLVMPALSSLVSLDASDQHQGRALGVFRSIGAFGRAVGPLTAALSYFAFGSALPYIFAAMLSLIPFILARGIIYEK